MERPDLPHWLWYAMGGGLPRRHGEWLLHDLTTRHWRWRALFRSVVQILPVAILIYVLLPTEPWVRVMALAGGLFVGMIYALAYLDESTEHRALKAGFARGTLAAVRNEADAGAREAAAVRYAERYRDGTTPRDSE